MPITNIRGRQILDGDVSRADLNSTVSSNAVIRRLLPSSDAAITLSSTGPDVGTGDVTLVASKATASQLGVVRIGAGLAVDASGIVSVTSGNIGGSGTTNYISKFTSSTTLGNSLLIDNGTGVSVFAQPSTVYRFNIQGVSGNYISFWTPTFSGTDQNGIISHDGNGLAGLRPLGFTGTEFVFGNTVTGGGLVQVNGDVNISGAFKINGTTIGTGGGGATSLATLSDVLLSSVSDGQVLTYSAANGKWINQTPSGGGGGGISGSGTTNYFTKWTSATSLGNSTLYDNAGELILDNLLAPMMTFKTFGTKRIGIGYSSAWGASFLTTNGNEMIFGINTIYDMILDSSARLKLGNTSSASLIFEFSGGDSVSKYTTLTGNLRATGRITQDLTNVRGIGFGYDASDQLGFIYGTTTSGVASKAAIVVYDGTFWKNMFTVKSNTINFPSLPNSSSGLVTGDLWRDASGFLRVV